MADFSQTLKQTWSGSGSTLSGTTTRTGDGKEERRIAVGAGVANKEVDIDFTYASLTLVYLLSDEDVTIYTNDVSGGSPANTIALTGGTPKVYLSSANYTNLFSANVTKMHITNAGATDATVEICILRDSTP